MAAGAMKKMAVYLGLVEDELDPYARDADGYDEYADDYEQPRAQEPEAPARSREPQAVTTLQQRRPVAPQAQAMPDQYRITTLHPRSYNDAKTIGLEFREGTPVIMNLTEMDDPDAKRIVDFAAGLVFGQRGTIERVTNKVFLLSPQNVDVGAETKARIAEGGFFNQS